MFNYVYIYERRIYILCATMWEPSRFDYVNKLSLHVWCTTFSLVRATDHDVIPAGGRTVWQGAWSCWLNGVLLNCYWLVFLATKWNSITRMLDIS
jgi:hypothetical protein